MVILDALSLAASLAAGLYPVGSCARAFVSEEFGRDNFVLGASDVG